MEDKQLAVDETTPPLVIRLRMSGETDFEHPAIIIGIVIAVYVLAVLLVWWFRNLLVAKKVCPEGCCDCVMCDDCLRSCTDCCDCQVYNVGGCLHKCCPIDKPVSLVEVLFCTWCCNGDCGCGSCCQECVQECCGDDCECCGFTLQRGAGGGNTARMPTGYTGYPGHPGTATGPPTWVTGIRGDESLRQGSTVQGYFVTQQPVPDTASTQQRY